MHKVKQNIINLQKIKDYSIKNNSKLMNNSNDINYLHFNASLKNISNNFTKSYKNYINLNTAQNYLNDINKEIFNGTSSGYLACASYLLSSTLVSKLLIHEIDTEI